MLLVQLYSGCLTVLILTSEENWKQNKINRDVSNWKYKEYRDMGSDLNYLLFRSVRITVKQHKYLKWLKIQYLDRGDPKSRAFVPSLFCIGYCTFFLCQFFLFAFWAPHPCSLYFITGKKFIKIFATTNKVLFLMIFLHY